MTKTLQLSNDILMVYNQLLANISRPMLENISCNQCGATFSDAKALAKHESSHNQNKRKHECKECGKRFNSSSDLKRHSLIHTNTRPYKCHLCPTAFVQQAHLTRHLKSHTRHGVRFKCLGCGTMFLHSTNVRWHQQFCEQARGSNGGYVVTQSEGEGLDSVNTTPTTPSKQVNESSPTDIDSNKANKTSRTTPPNWGRENKIYYFDGPFSVKKNNGRRHSSSSDNDIGSSDGNTNSLLNPNNLVYFDGPYDKSELMRASKPKSEHSAKPPSANHLSASQLSYLNSRVSMVAPQPLKNIPPLQSPKNLPTEDILKLLATFQDNKSKLSNKSPHLQTVNIKQEASSPPFKQESTETAFSQLQATLNKQHSTKFLPQRQLFPMNTEAQQNCPKLSPTYKIVPNKIIQHNVTTSVRQALPQPSTTHEDKIRPILDLIKKLVAEGLQSPAADVILKAISKHLGNMTTLPEGSYPSFTQHCNKKRRLLDPPSQEMLNNNLLAAQNMLSTNMTSLLNTPTSQPPLSFTPLLFRQFPHISSTAPQLNKPAFNFKPSATANFTTHLLQLTTATLSPQTATLSPQTATLSPQTATLSPQTATLSPQTATLSPQTATLSPQTATLSPKTSGTLDAQHNSQKKQEFQQQSEAEGQISKSPCTYPVQLCEESRGMFQPMQTENNESRDISQTMETETESTRDSTNELLQDEKNSKYAARENNIESSKNIAFHRLKDLLSLV